MPTRTFNAPAEVLAIAGMTALRNAEPSTQRHPAITYSQRAVLAAAVRAACEAPPPAPVSYPTLTTAARSVSLPLTDDLHAALRIVEARAFYGRTAWLVFYALVHYPDRIEALLRMEPEALAQLDARVIALNPEVSTCPVPITTRAPRAPKASPKK